MPMTIRIEISTQCVNAELANALRNCFTLSGRANAAVAKPINQIPASMTIAAAINCITSS